MTLRLESYGLTGCFVVLALAACSGGSETVASKYVATATIGAAGGSIPVDTAEDATLAGTSIVIPAGALTADTTISIGLSIVPVPLPKGGTVAGPVVDFEPSGTKFAVPVTITIPTTATSAANTYVEAVEADGSTSVIPVASVSAGHATFKANGFTDFGAWTGTPTSTTGTGCSDDAECPTGEACVDGVCSSSTTTTTTGCGGDADCAAGQVCIDGVCESGVTTITDGGSDAKVDGGDKCGDGICSAGETCSSCPADCGTCAGCSNNEDCASGEVCVGGECVSGTTTTDACVPATCASLGLDCGTTDDGCGGTLDCGTCPADAGSDVTVCAAGETDCGGFCADLESDPSNCGACGETCPTGELCSAGACKS